MLWQLGPFFTYWHYNHWILHGYPVLPCIQCTLLLCTRDHLITILIIIFVKVRIRMSRPGSGFGSLNWSRHNFWGHWGREQSTVHICSMLEMHRCKRTELRLLTFYSTYTLYINFHYDTYTYVYYTRIMTTIMRWYSQTITFILRTY
jgi:hypothetical protein